VILDQELEALAALLDGSAVQDHMEPVYLQNLSEAAVAALGAGRGAVEEEVDVEELNAGLLDDGGAGDGDGSEEGGGGDGGGGDAGGD
jgi:hypothetical protein